MRLNEEHRMAMKSFILKELIGANKRGLRVAELRNAIKARAKNDRLIAIPNTGLPTEVSRQDVMEALFGLLESGQPIILEGQYFVHQPTRRAMEKAKPEILALYLLCSRMVANIDRALNQLKQP